MIRSSKAIAIAALISAAIFPVFAEEAPRFYTGAGAGFTTGAGLDTAPVWRGEESLGAFGGFKLNSRFDVEGFYAKVSPMALLTDSTSNLYTRSLMGNGRHDEAASTVTGVSLVTRLADMGPFRPFARAGVHRYDLKGNGRNTSRGNNLLFGAGAEIDLSTSWNTRMEWEHYNASGGLDRDIFSLRLEYRF